MTIDKIRALSLEYAKGNMVSLPERKRPLKHGGSRKSTKVIPARVKNMQTFGEEAKSRKQELRRKATRAELVFGEILKSFRIPYAFQKLVFTENRYFILDFVIHMTPKLVVEIDGDSHLGRVGYDATRTKLVLRTKVYNGFRVLRIRNEQVFNGEAAEIIAAEYPRQAQRWWKIAA